mgnify:CR=1 FL=1
MRIDDATRAGDHVYAVIRSTAVNQDGATSTLTAPNQNAQERLVRAALQQEPRDRARRRLEDAPVRHEALVGQRA